MWNLANHKIYKNQKFNIFSIIRASFDAETINFFLQRGKSLGFKYYNPEALNNLAELAIEQITALAHINKKIEVYTKVDSNFFLLSFEESYSAKAHQPGFRCNFKEITPVKNEPDKVTCIKLMLRLIDGYFIYEFHAQKGEYIHEED